VGLKSEMSISSELWFGASVNPLVTFTWSSETSSADSGEISYIPFAEVVVSTCNATLHSKRAHKLFYLTIKLQFNIHLTYYSRNNQKDLKLDLDRTLGGQLIRFGYLLKITTEPFGTTGV
jgi:hypothetical protein